MKRKPVLDLVTLLLVAEATYAAFFSFTVYTLLSSISMVRGEALLLSAVARSLEEAVLISLVYASASSLLPLYTSQTVFSIGLTAFNLFIAWRVATFWRYTYYALLAQPATVIITSLLIMPEATGAFFIVISFLLLIASQSREFRASRGRKVEEEKGIVKEVSES